jgi:hypothetical protein
MNLVKENLSLFVPALVELVDYKDFPWERIDKLFLKKIDTRMTQHKEGDVIEASIYDIIIAAKIQNIQALRLLQFFNKLFEELNDNLNPIEKLLVRTNAKQMMCAFDINYLNFLGELATLNYLIKTKRYELKGIEEKIANGKTIDFKLQSIKDKKIVLVEILNIHLNPSRVVENDEAIKKFLFKKIIEKIEAKRNGLLGEQPFFLIPVIWGGWKDIEIYSNFFKTNKIDVFKTMEPFAYLQHSDGKGHYRYYFDAISNLIFRSP